MTHANYKATKWAKSGFACTHQDREHNFDCNDKARHVCTKHSRANWCGYARCKNHLPKKKAKKS